MDRVEQNLTFYKSIYDEHGWEGWASWVSIEAFVVEFNFIDVTL